MKKVLEQYIRTLIQFESTAKNSRGRSACARWIAKELKRTTQGHGVRVETVTHNGVQSVLAARGTWKKPDVLLNAHYDVVPGKPTQFKPQRDGDRLFGRGAADMKGGVASLMLAFSETIRTQPDLSIGIMITGDEEIGGQNGAEWLAKEGWKPKMLINFDGGYGEELTHAEKGILYFTMRAKGKTALPTYPWEAINAFDIIVNAYTKLREVFPQAHRASRENNWHTTWTVTNARAQSSKGENIVDEATVEIGVHFVEDVTPKALLKRIQGLLPEVKITGDFFAPRVWMRADHPEMKRFQKIYTTELGHTPRIRGENGSSDARFFTHLNIPIIITKPKGGNPELDNEWVSLTSVEKLTRTTIRFLKEMK